MISELNAALEDLCGRVEAKITATREKYLGSAGTPYEEWILEELQDLIPKIESGKANLINLFSRTALSLSTTEAYFRRRTPTGPGRIRLIVPVANKEDLDVEFATLEEFQAIEGQLRPLDRQLLYPGLQQYFIEHFGREWDEYLRAHPDEEIPTIKYENKQIVRLDAHADELVSKKALAAVRETFRPNQLTDQIIEAFWDHRRAFREFMQEDDLMEVQEGLSYTLIELSEATQQRDEGRIREIYQSLNDKNEEFLTKYPKIGYLILSNPEVLEKHVGACKRILKQYPEIVEKYPDLEEALGEFPTYAEFLA